MGLTERGLIRRAKGLTKEQQEKLQKRPKRKSSKVTAGQLGLTGEDVAQLLKETGDKPTSRDIERAAIEKQTKRLVAEGVAEKTARQITTGEIRSETGFAVVSTKGRKELSTPKAAEILAESRRQEQEKLLRKQGIRKKEAEQISKGELRSETGFAVVSVGGKKELATPEAAEFLAEARRQEQQRQLTAGVSVFDLSTPAQRDLLFTPATKGAVEFSIEKRMQEKELKRLVESSIVPKIIQKLPEGVTPPEGTGLEKQFGIVSGKIKEKGERLGVLSEALTTTSKEQLELLRKDETVTPEQLIKLQDPGLSFKTEVSFGAEAFKVGVTLAALGVTEGVIGTVMFGREIITDPISAGKKATNITAQIRGAGLRIMEEPISGVVSVGTQAFLFKKGTQATIQYGGALLKSRTPTVVSDGVPMRGVSLAKAGARARQFPAVPVPSLIKTTAEGFKIETPRGRTVRVKLRENPLQVKRKTFGLPTTRTKVKFVPVGAKVKVSKTGIPETTVETIKIKTPPASVEVIDVKQVIKGVEPVYTRTGERQIVFPKVKEFLPKRTGDVIVERTVVKVPTPKDPIKQFEQKITPEVALAGSRAIGQRGITEFKDFPTGVLSRLEKESLYVRVSRREPIQTELQDFSRIDRKPIKPPELIEKELGIGKFTIGKKAQFGRTGLISEQLITGYGKLKTKYGFKGYDPSGILKDPTIGKIKGVSKSGLKIQEFISIAPGLAAEDFTQQFQPSRTKQPISKGIDTGIGLNLFTADITDVSPTQQLKPFQEIKPIERLKITTDVTTQQIFITPSPPIITGREIRRPIPPPPKLPPILEQPFKLQDVKKKKKKKKSKKELEAEQPIKLPRTAFGTLFNIKPIKTKKAVKLGLRI